MKTVYCNVPAHHDYWTTGYVVTNTSRIKRSPKSHVTHNSSIRYLIRGMRLIVKL